jgi:glutamate-ammonia-ligase adenylyltransferase
MQQVTGAMTALAEFALDASCTHARGRSWTRNSALRALESGARARLWIMGMGKLGARELNVSSDIDLIYVYDQDGETDGNAEGRSRISNQEYFSKVGAQHLRPDRRHHRAWLRVPGRPGAAAERQLRPGGDLAGRTGRVLPCAGPRMGTLCLAQEPGGGARGTAWPAAPSGSLRSVVLSFVFRRYLDYNVFDALRVLHRQIREHAARRSAGHPERTNDVKLSRGGIREIEFIVQLLQVVRGGQYPELRTRAHAGRPGAGWHGPG